MRDFLKICHVIKKTYPELPLVLFAHSMGGAIGTIAAAWEPQLFQKIILNSPMLRPLTGNVPWPLVIAIAQTKCLLGREEDYVAGQKPYDGSETSKPVDVLPDQDSKNIMRCVKRIKNSRLVQLLMGGFWRL